MSEEGENAYKGNFASFYKNLCLQAGGEQKAFRLFQRRGGEYYTVYGCDAVWSADELFESRDVLKEGTDGLVYVHVQRRRLARLLEALLASADKPVQLYELSQEQRWLCTRTAEPNDTDGILRMLDSHSTAVARESTLVMALNVRVRQHQREIGIALLDQSQRSIEIAQFFDNEGFSHLESVLVQNEVRECVMAPLDDSDSDGRRLQALLQKCDVPLRHIRKGDFQSSDIEQHLKRLLGNVERHLGELEQTLAMESVSALIRSADLLSSSSSSSSSSWSLRSLCLADCMRLDTSAMRALNLFPSAIDANKFSSVFGVLNHTQTASGARLLRQWMKQPLLNLQQLRERQDIVCGLVSDSELSSSLSTSLLRRVPDFPRLCNRFQQRKATLSDCVSLYLFSVRLPALVAALANYSGEEEFASLLQSSFVQPLEKIVSDISTFENLIEQTVDLDAIERHEYIVKASFSPELSELQGQISELHDEIERMRLDVATNINLDEKKVKLQQKDGIGYHLRITRKDEKKLRGKRQFLVIETRKDGVRFSSVALRRLSKQLSDLQRNYDQQQRHIVDKVVSVASSYSPVFIRCSSVLSVLDVSVSLAVTALNSSVPYCRPSLLPLGSGRLELKQSRHPCLELQEHCHSFIANDANFDAHSKFQLISGPNMGGKSTYIRQVGVIVLMAQIGSLVPCESAIISVVDRILVRVGAGDNQMRGVSTFMAEMLEANAILNGATKDSLLIIDELGRGTSTYDGFGLAWAISEHIAEKIGCFCMFATHFHELTELATTCPSVVNSHVTASTDGGGITMLYEVKEGSCDRSFGIHVAQLAKFPPSVVQMAQQKVSELEHFNEPSSRDGPSNMVDEFMALPLPTLSDAEVLSRVRSLLGTQ